MTGTCSWGLRDDRPIGRLRTPARPDVLPRGCPSRSGRAAPPECRGVSSAPDTAVKRKNGGDQGCWRASSRPLADGGPARGDRPHRGYGELITRQRDPLQGIWQRVPPRADSGRGRATTRGTLIPCGCRCRDSILPGGKWTSNTRTNLLSRASLCLSPATLIGSSGSSADYKKAKPAANIATAVSPKARRVFGLTVPPEFSYRPLSSRKPFTVFW